MAYHFFGYRCYNGDKRTPVFYNAGKEFISGPMIIALFWGWSGVQIFVYIGVIFDLKIKYFYSLSHLYKNLSNRKVVFFMLKMNKQNGEKTVAEVFEEFIKYCRVKNLSKRTIEYYEDSYNSFVKFCDSSLKAW